MVPKAKLMAVLMSDNPTHPSQVKAIQDAVRGFGVTVLPTMVVSSGDFDAAFRSMTKQKAEALVVLGGPPFSSSAQRGKLLGLAAKTRLPTIYRTRNWVNEGGLMSYGPDALKNWRIAASYVDISKHVGRVNTESIGVDAVAA